MNDMTDKYFNVKLLYLTDVYNALYHSLRIVSRFYKEYLSLVINDTEYISKYSRSQRSAARFARGAWNWCQR